MIVLLRKPLLRFGILALFAFAILAIPRMAGAGTIDQLSAQVIQFCTQNYPDYLKAEAMTHRNPPPQIPTPLVVDPPCFECGQSSATKTVLDVNAWMMQSEQPETDAVKLLLDISKEYQLLANLYPQLSPAAQKCFNKFDPLDATNKAQKVMYRLYDGKAIAMAQKYHKNPKMAYAGTQFVLREAKSYQLLVPGASDSAAIDQVKQWLNSIIDYGKTQIYTNHMWNICPSYTFLFRQIEVLGGTDSSTEDEYVADIQKLAAFTKFKVTMDLHAKGTNSDGAVVDVAWTGTANMHFEFDGSKGCYTAKIDGGGFQMKNDSWQVTAKGGEVDLDSPTEFTLPVERVSVDLCDDSPMIHFVFAGYGDGEDATAKSDGHSQGVHLNMFQQMMTTAIVGDKALSGKYTKSSADSAKTQLQALKAQMQAHQGDMQWLMGPQGQAVIAQMQSVAAGATGVAPGTSSGGPPTGAATISNDVGVRWTNGQANPVDQTLKLDKSTFDDELHVTVEQNSD